LIHPPRIRAGRLAGVFGARGHYENFPVASLLLPAAMRPHVAALYAFARTADDFADEGDRPDAERLRLLDGWSRRLHHASTSGADGWPPDPGEPPDAVATFRALGLAIRERALPVVLMADLLSAFRQDVTVHRYASWEDLFDYCRRSANPIGRLVLRIAGHSDARLDSWSDAICTALQLTNFWQDLRVDFARGRIYVPADVMRTFNAAEPFLAAERTTGEWRAALSSLVARTRELFARGRPLCDSVRGRLRYELRATWLGGTRILDRLAASDFDPLAHRPAVGARDLPWLAWRMAGWPLAASRVMP
jgi:hydroxysqualene synthase